MRRILAIAVMTACLVLLSLNLYGMDKDIHKQPDRDKEIDVLRHQVSRLEKRVAFLEYKLSPHYEFIGETGSSEMTPLLHTITIEVPDETRFLEVPPLLQDVTIIELPGETR